MKSYFSSLIEQTGMTFGTGTGFRPGGLEPYRRGSETREEIEPIHVEESEFIEPQTDQKVEKTHGDVGKASEKSVPVIKVENIQHSTEERFESRIPEKSQSHTSERGEPRQQKHEPEEKKFKVLDRGIQTSPERDRPKRKISAGESLERKEAVEGDASGKRHVQPAGKPSVSANQEFKEDSVFQPGAKSDDRVNQEQIRQATLKEVREWVVDTPVEGEGEIKGKDARETMRMGKKIPHPFDQREVPISSYIRPTESPQEEKPEIHDFHLSIGTISLTIEEPQKEIQSNEPSKIERERKLRPETNSSRLSRHYIRI